MGGECDTTRSKVDISDAVKRISDYHGKQKGGVNLNDVVEENYNSTDI